MNDETGEVMPPPIGSVIRYGAWPGVMASSTEGFLEKLALLFLQAWHKAGLYQELQRQ